MVAILNLESRMEVIMKFSHKYSFIVVLLFFPLSSIAALKSHSNDYSYRVQVLPPFGSVLINGTITCPAPGSNSPFCLVSNQVIGSVMSIKGCNDHICYLTIEEDGAAEIDAGRSVFCTIQSTPATHHSEGHITLPNHF